MKRFLSNNIIVIGAALLLGLLAWALIHEYRRNARITAILNGPIRGNRNSRIYHVPTCPQYNAIAGSNVHLFASVADASNAGYRPALNCLDAIDIRSVNETESSDNQASYEDPRQ